MNNKRKLILLSGAMLVMHSLSGCNLDKMEAYFAPDRRLPEGSDTTFDNRHTPLLNPGGNDNSRHSPQENGGSVENNIPTVQKLPVVPVETASMSEPQPPQAAAGEIPSAVAAPVNLSQDAFAPPAPVASANAAGYPALASVPQRPEVPAQKTIKHNFASLANEQKSAAAERQSLMDDSSATVLTSPKTGQVVANAAEATPSNNLAAPALTTPAIQVTAPAAVPAPQSATEAPTMATAAQPVEQQQPAAPIISSQASQGDAPAAMRKPSEVASADNSDKGFGNWLHNMFANDDQKNPAPAATSPAAERKTVFDMNARRVPVENPPVDTAVAPEPQMAQPEAQANNGAPVLHRPGQHTATVSPAPAQATTAAQATALTAPVAQVTETAPATTLDSPPNALFVPAQPNTAPVAAASAGTENTAPVRSAEVPMAQPETAARNDGSKGGLGSWMGEIFGSKKEIANTAAAAPANAEPQAASANGIEQATLPPVGATAPATAQAAVPVAANNGLPPVSELQQKAPTDLSPAPVNAKQLPDIAQLATPTERPVSLVQPEYAPGYGSQGYLDDSRYAERTREQSNN